MNSDVRSRMTALERHYFFVPVLHPSLPVLAVSPDIHYSYKCPLYLLFFMSCPSSASHAACPCGGRRPHPLSSLH